jgi:hypothetical protein
MITIIGKKYNLKFGSDFDYSNIILLLYKSFNVLC